MIESLSSQQKQELSSASISVPEFSLQGRKIWVKVVGVYDADTCRVVLYLGDTLTQFNVRLTGIDTPEMRPSRNKPNRDIEKKKAIQARNRLITLVSDVQISPDSHSRKKTIQNLLAKNNKLVVLECGDFDKYGRLLGRIKITRPTTVGGGSDGGGNGVGDCDSGCEGEAEIDVNNILIKEGFARKYDGGKKIPWTWD